jgi:hypothetical protein
MAALIFASLSMLSMAVAAQVNINVRPHHQGKYELVQASVKNSGSKPITFCIEVGQWSP